MKPTIYANAFCSLVPSKLEKGIRINDKADMRNDITLYSNTAVSVFTHVYHHRYLRESYRFFWALIDHAKLYMKFH